MIPSRLPDVGTTIFSVMTALAGRHRAINLSQGFPDFPVPPRLRALLAEHVEAGHNQYAPLAGVPALRERVAQQVTDRYRRRVDAEAEVTIVPGATAGLYAAFTAALRPGDEVLLLDPSYDSYAPAVRLNGARPVRVPLQAPRFLPDWDRVAAAVTPRSRLIVLNSPHNPAGSMLSAADLDELERLVERYDLLVVSDEVYEHLVFDGAEHHSLLRSDALWPRLFAVFSFGKSFHATGWKTGYCVAPAALSAELRKMHQFQTFVAVTPVQWALADFMAECPEHLASLPGFYQARRDLFVSLLREAGFDCRPAAGAYFQLVDCRDLWAGKDTELAEWLVREHGVAAIPLSVFSETPIEGCWLRFCFAKRDDTLRAAAERLAAWRQGL